MLCKIYFYISHCDQRVASGSTCLKERKKKDTLPTLRPVCDCELISPWCEFHDTQFRERVTCFCIQKHLVYFVFTLDNRNNWALYRARVAIINHQMELLLGALVLIRTGCALTLIRNAYIDHYASKKNRAIFSSNMFSFKTNFCGLVGLSGWTRTFLYFFAFVKHSVSLLNNNCYGH